MFCSEHVKINGNLVFKVVTELKLDAKMNEHGILTVRGMVEEADSAKVDDILSLEFNTGKEIVLLFQGYIIKSEVFYEHKVNYLTLTSISGTYRFDLERKKRSFQNVSTTFGEMTRKIAGVGKAIVVPEQARQKIQRLWIQYEETDWEFLKRIAGYLQTVITPEITNKYSQCSLGVVKGKVREIKLDEVYKSEINYELYNIKKHKMNCAIYDFIKLYIVTDQNFNLGDKVKVHQQILLVSEKKVVLERGALNFFYGMGTEIESCLWDYGNYKMAGNSLKGKVEYREKERIRLKLDIDKEKSEKSDMLFDYVPLTGNIMYAIPEVGAKVSLYLPNKDESNAIVVECFNETDLYSDCTQKVMSTKEEKYMELEPQNLKFSGKHHKQRLELLDRDGICIDSSSTIRLKAGTTINITAGAAIYGEADDSLFFTDLESGDYVELSGNEIGTHSEQIIISGLTRKKREQKERSPADGMNIIGKYVDSMLGGIPQNANSLIENAVLGGIPLYSDPKKISGLAEMIGVVVDK